MALPSAALQGTTYTSLTIDEGTYQYDSANQTINVDGQNVVSYGTVVIDITTQ
ncbi:MAG: hypothetical protein OHK0019_09350 [Saprospiraceae bacterium]